VKKIIYAVLGLVVGVGLIVFGITTQSGPVKCGGQVMERGDSCVSFGRDSGTRDYDAQRAKNQREGWLELGVGVLFLIGGGIVLALRVRDRRRAAAMAPPTPL
jgi:hypothetical protein